MPLTDKYYEQRAHYSERIRMSSRVWNLNTGTRGEWTLNCPLNTKPQDLRLYTQIWCDWSLWTWLTTETLQLLAGLDSILYTEHGEYQENGFEIEIEAEEQYTKEAHGTKNTK